MVLRMLAPTTAADLAGRPSPTLFSWLVGAFVLTLFPHVAQLPSWLTCLIVTALVVRCVAEWRRWPLPSTTVTGFVALCLFAAIFLQFHTILGRDAGTPFMAGLLTIKFFELRGQRDITLIIFSSFFVMMSALLFSQAIELFIYCLIMMWVLTAILLRTYMGDQREQNLLRVLRTSSLVLLQALPFAVLLFFFLPRYTGRFQFSLNDAAIGLTDHVEPGSVARLSNDDSPAMRVHFGEKFVPMAGMLYWRAIVLWQFDGRSWTRGREADLPSSPPSAPLAGEKIEQDIILWPQNERWIPALDRPVTLAQEAGSSSPWSVSLIGDVLVPRNNQPIEYKRHYKIVSCLNAMDQRPVLGNAATQLPERIDTRVRDLAARLFAPNHDTTAYIQAVLHYFRDQKFQLSTEPGTLSRSDPVADFLFNTKTGYCEHYASAFAVLMRLHHIPTRMIAGYRGGEFNSYGSFILVTQSNAHAWDEVWVDTRKAWVRVDPTSIIASGSSRALAIAAGLNPDDDFSLQVAEHRYTLVSGAYLPTWVRDGLRDVQMRREQLEAQWDDWIVSYDPDTQERLSQLFGLGEKAWLVLLAGCVAVTAFGGAFLAYSLTRKKKLSAVESFYARFCRNMAKRGAPRERWEGPLAYTERLATRFPTQQKPIQQAGWIVAEHRYAAEQREPHAHLHALLREVSQKP